MRKLNFRSAIKAIFTQLKNGGVNRNPESTPVNSAPNPARALARSAGHFNHK